MERLPVSRAQYTPTGGKVVELTGTLDVAFVTISASLAKVEEADDILSVQLDWCQCVHVAEGDSIHLRVVMVPGTLVLLAPYSSESKRKVQRFLRRHHGTRVMRISTDEFRMPVPTALPIDTTNPPAGWPYHKRDGDDVEMRVATPPASRKRGQEALSSGLRAPSRHGHRLGGDRHLSASPSPLSLPTSVAISDLWKPTCQQLDLDSFASGFDVTNFALDAFSGLLQNHLDQDGRRVWVAPLAMTSRLADVPLDMSMGEHFIAELDVGVCPQVVGQRDLWLMPVLDRKSNHYWLLVRTSTEWVVLDSMQRKDSDRYERVFDDLLVRLYRLGFPPFPLGRQYRLCSTPQQTDGESCGIYVMKSMCLCAWGNDGEVEGWGPEQSMSDIRKEMHKLLLAAVTA